MARGNQREADDHSATISLIGPGMEVVGDCSTDGTLRVEGSITGTIYAGKAVVVGKDGAVHGDIRTQDAVVSGGVTGTLQVASRLEVQATSRIEGTIRTRRLQLEEGAVLNGDVHMEEVELGAPPAMDQNGANREASPAHEGAHGGASPHGDGKGAATDSSAVEQ